MKNKRTIFFSFFIFMILAKNVFADTEDFFLASISDTRKQLLDYALTFQGVPYVWGGVSPNGFDCSGFVYYVFNNGINCPLARASTEQYKISVKIDESDREPGDLIFFKDLSSGKIDHVGIYYGLYIGNDQRLYGKEVFLSAVSEGPRTGIVLAATDENYWKKHFLGYGRVLNGDSERYIASADIDKTYGDKAKEYRVAKMRRPSPSFQNNWLGLAGFAGLPGLYGRRGVYISADMEMEKLDFSSSEYFKSPYINNIYISYIGDVGQFFFYGAKVGINTLSFSQTPLFSFGLEGGMQFSLLNLLTPYIEVGATYKTNKNVELKVGGGLDIKVARIIIKLGYDYNIPFSVEKIKEDGISSGKETNFHSLSFGIGYAL